MIEVRTRGSVTVLRIRHGKVNALDVELCEEITRRLDECRESATGAVVLTAAGRSFSAGVDLVRVLEGGPDYLRTFLPPLRRMFEAVFLYPRPLVAAINGHAIAGGCVLACAADHRIMAAGDGRIGVSELRVGVPYPDIALEIMRFATERRYFEALLHSGEAVSGEAAGQRGLVQCVVPSRRLLDTALKVADDLAALPAAAFSLTKQQLRSRARATSE